MTLADTAAEVLEATGLDQYFWDEQPTLYPGTDFHDDVLYLTVPLWKTEMVEVGKGKNMHLVPKKVQRTICVTSDREYFDFNEEQLDQRGFVMPEFFIQKRESNWPLPDVKQWLAGAAPIIDGKALFSSFVPASPGDGSLSFFGIVFDEPLIARVRITTGDTAPGPDDDEKQDIVTMDDFIYGEPQPR